MANLTATLLSFSQNYTSPSFRTAILRYIYYSRKPKKAARLRNSLILLKRLVDYEYRANTPITKLKCPLDGFFTEEEQSERELLYATLLDYYTKEAGTKK